MTDDPRVDAARYRASRDSDSSSDSDSGSGSANHGAQPLPGAAERAAYVETALQQAIRRGDFDDLPGAGLPIEGLGQAHDPDWWIRRKIQTEQLSGLGPPALMLRVEHDGFTERIDALAREDDVREYVTDFNRRVIEARRQLLGGPPVVTPTHDVDDEVAAWLERRQARGAASVDPPRPDAPTPRRRGLFRRR